MQSSGNVVITTQKQYQCSSNAVVMQINVNGVECNCICNAKQWQCGINAKCQCSIDAK